MFLLIQTLALFLVFSLFSFFSFYLLGFMIIVSKRKILERQEMIAFSLSLGMVLFVLFGIILSFMHIRWFLLPLILLISLFLISKYKLFILDPWKIFIKDKTLLILIVLGILTQGFINFPSGYLYQNGLQFWSSQGHDGLWHVSSMEIIKQSIPPQNPGFAGETLYNYHYLVDILMGEFGRIFPFFTSLDLYFRFFPVIFSLLIGISTFAFVSRWKNNKSIGYWAIFFTYFCGSFGYIVIFLRSKQLFGGETVFWAAQQNTIIGNPPHAISHGLLATFFLGFLIYLRERKIIWMLISFLVGSILAGFKVSGGFVMLAGLGVASLIDFINKRKISTLVFVFLMGLSNFITFKSMTYNAASFLMFLPWWFIRTMVVDRLGWIDLELQRQHYLSKGTWHATLRVMQLEATAFMIFVVGNLGIRVVGAIELVRNFIFRKLEFLKDPMEIMLLVTMLTGFIMPLLFVQKGLIYNNIQFMQYFLFIFGFYGAISTYRILTSIKNKAVKIIVAILIVSLAIPTVIGNLVEFYGPGRTALSKISPAELVALKYLKDNSKDSSVILTVFFDKSLKNKFGSQPWPIYAWYDTSYVSALSGRPSYLASEHVTLLFYPSTDQRIENKRRFFEQSDFYWNREFLKKAKIGFVYVAKNELKTALDTEKNGLDIFFDNEEVIIYKVK